jgi:hypothetical protein
MNKTLLTSLLSLSVFFFMGASVVLAQRPTTPPTDSSAPTSPGTGNGIKFENPFTQGDTLYELAETIVNKIVLPVGGVLAVLSFIYSGFLYVTAQGSDTKIKSAHLALLYTAVGTAVLLGAWVFTNVIKNTVNSLVS